MTAEQPARYPFPHWYLVLSAVVGVIATAGLILGVIGVYVNTQQDAASEAANKAHDVENRRLLKCFDEYAAESSQTSTVVREATVSKDAAMGVWADALKAEDAAFLATVDHILANAVTPQDVQRLRATLLDRKNAAEKLDRALARLDRAREKNPVPPPPSEFCAPGGPADTDTP